MNTLNTMPIKILKEGDTIRLLSSDQLLPEGKPIILFTEAEIKIVSHGFEQLDLQINTFWGGDEDEPAEELF